MGTYSLPASQDLALLKTPIVLETLASGAELSARNRLAIQPMEGADGEAEGSPGELTIRRYDRFAESGAALLWFEAVAIRHEGRANPRQLWLHKKNVESYKRIVSRIREKAAKERGLDPIIIMQATHSGRYSKPESEFVPIIACNNPIFEKERPLSADRIISDDELKRLEEEYAAVTRLAMSAGFDGIDIKACHRYLISELLSAHSRPGIYGGSLENRMRFFLNCIENARVVADKNFAITSRMNIYDGFPYPYGFGSIEGEELEPDLGEAISVVKATKFSFINITMGNPYVNPQVNRPTETAAVERMYSLTKQVKAACPEVKFIASAPTFMKEESGSLCAGAIEQGYADMVGFGRMAFAYPHFARDIMEGQFDKKQTCICCGKCTELMRASQAGCAVRDPLYTKLYQEL